MDDWLIVLLKWLGQVFLAIGSTVLIVVKWLNGRVTRLEETQGDHSERLAVVETHATNQVNRLNRIELAIRETRHDLMEAMERLFHQRRP